MAAYRQFLSFRFSLNNIKWTYCIRHPFCMTAKPLVAYQKTYRRSISRWDFGNKLSASSIHHRVSRLAVKIGIFYINRVPTQLSLNKSQLLSQPYVQYLQWNVEHTGYKK